MLAYSCPIIARLRLVLWRTEKQPNHAIREAAVVAQVVLARAPFYTQVIACYSAAQTSFAEMMARSRLERSRLAGFGLQLTAWGPYPPLGAARCGLALDSLLSPCVPLLPVPPGGLARHCVPRPSAAWHSCRIL